MRLVSKAIYDQNMVFAIEKWPKMTKNYEQVVGGTIYPSFCAKFDAEFNETSFKGYLWPKYSLCHRKMAKNGRIQQVKPNIGINESSSKNQPIGWLQTDKSSFIMLINVVIQPERLKWVTEAGGWIGRGNYAVAAMVVLVENLARSKWLLSIQDFIWVLVIIKP